MKTCTHPPNTYPPTHTTMQSCGAGQYIRVTCNGTGNHDTTQCVDCKDCGDFYIIDPCDGKGIRDTQKCVACMCPPGQYMSKLCVGEETDPGCRNCTTECPPGFYLTGVSLLFVRVRV